MVGIVIVSHSPKVANGIRDLAVQMSADADLIVPAGGLEDGSIGTDVVKIMNAVLSVDKGDGVAIFVDLGSAIMSAQMALELIEDSGQKVNAQIADCAILEGTICAAVSASSGADLDEVIKVAIEGAKMAKI